MVAVETSRPHQAPASSVSHGRFPDKEIDLASYGGRNLAIGFSLDKANNVGSVYFFTPDTRAGFDVPSYGTAGNVLGRAAATLMRENPGMAVTANSQGVFRNSYGHEIRRA